MEISTGFILQWFGCAFGAAGSLLLAKKSPKAAWSWPLYLVSNLCWFAFGYITGAWGLVVQQAIFTATTFIGLWSWCAKPHLTRRKQIEESTIALGYECADVATTR